jgi:hypothetical protein
MPRWLLAVLAVSVLVLLAGTAWPIIFPAGNPRLTRQNFDRIKEGMRREEVEAILGPPGDYRTAPTRRFFILTCSSQMDPGLSCWQLGWAGDEAEIWYTLIPTMRPSRLTLSRWYPSQWAWSISCAGGGTTGGNPGGDARPFLYDRRFYFLSRRLTGGNRMRRREFGAAIALRALSALSAGKKNPAEVQWAEEGLSRSSPCPVGVAS